MDKNYWENTISYMEEIKKLGDPSSFAKFILKKLSF